MQLELSLRGEIQILFPTHYTLNATCSTIKHTSVANFLCSAISSSVSSSSPAEFSDEVSNHVRSVQAWRMPFMDKV